MTSFELNANLRTDLGKGASRRLRHADKVPAIIYGADKDPQSLTLIHKDVVKALSQEAFYSHVLTLHVDGKPESAILKAVQRHPVRQRILHMDFQRIKQNEALTMHVPLHFIHDDAAPGVKEGTAQVAHLISNVEVSCLPANLPEYIEVDLSGITLGQILHLSDLVLPKGVTLTALGHQPGHDVHDLPVASLSAVKAVKEEEVEVVPEVAEAKEGEEGAAPAVPPAAE